MEMCSVHLSACLDSYSVGLWSEEKGLSPGPEAWLCQAGSQCQRHWERWLSPAHRRVAAHVWSVCHARVDPELSGSLKSQGFRRQYEGFCQARAPFAASHLVSRSASKVVLYSQLGGSAHSIFIFYFQTFFLRPGFWLDSKKLLVGQHQPS